MAVSSTLDTWVSSGYGPFSVRRDGDGFVITLEHADVAAALERGTIRLSRTVPVAWPETDGDSTQADMRVQLALHQLSLVRDDLVTISGDRDASTAAVRLWVDAEVAPQQLASAVRTTALLAELAAATVAELSKAMTAEAAINALTEATMPREDAQIVATPAESAPVATATPPVSTAPVAVEAPLPAPAPPVPTPTPPLTPPAPPAQPTLGWLRTHVVPQGGLPSWPIPDPSTQTTPLDAGLEVQVTEWNGPWAHIVCTNGWAAWVDGTRLTAP